MLGRLLYAYMRDIYVLFVCIADTHYIYMLELASNRKYFKKQSYVHFAPGVSRG